MSLENYILAFGELHSSFTLSYLQKFANRESNSIPPLNNEAYVTTAYKLFNKGKITPRKLPITMFTPISLNRGSNTGSYGITIRQGKPELSSPPSGESKTVFNPYFRAPAQHQSFAFDPVLHYDLAIYAPNSRALDKIYNAVNNRTFDYYINNEFSKRIFTTSLSRALEAKFSLILFPVRSQFIQDSMEADPDHPTLTKNQQRDYYSRIYSDIKSLILPTNPIRVRLINQKLLYELGYEALTPLINNWIEEMEITISLSVDSEIPKRDLEVDESKFDSALPEFISILIDNEDMPQAESSDDQINQRV